MSLKDLDKVFIEIVESSSMGRGNVQGTASHLGKADDVLEFNEKQKKEAKLKGEKLAEEDMSEEELVEYKMRHYIRKRIAEIKKQQNKILQERKKEENHLRKIIRKLLQEADISDIHPHRSTAINVLEELLKKMIPTLRADYKRLTTDESQRNSFRSHVVKAIKDSLMPSLVNDQYGQPSAVLQAPPATSGGDDEVDLEEPTEDEGDLTLEFQILDEIEIDLEDEPDEEKKIPVEDDDTPSDEEEFGTGLEDMDETGRNMAYASYKKVQQYILDSYDTLANGEDKKIFVDYLITNVKLYFDKFEDELQKTVEEPTTDEYEKVKSDSL